MSLCLGFAKQKSDHLARNEKTQKKQDLTELLVRPTKKRAIKIEQNLTGVNRVESSEKLNVF